MADDVSKRLPGEGLSFTGERCVPGKTPWRIEFEHLARYIACVPLVRQKAVIDVACGSGYGSRVLAETAERVLGVDISGAAVQYARETYSAPNVTFQIGSVEEIPAPAEAFDFLVSFETIEHVDAGGQSRFVAEARRVLRDDGVLIVSTPDKRLSGDLWGDSEEFREFHVSELYRTEFLSLLSAVFPKVDLYYQRLSVYSEIWKEGEYANSAPRIEGAADAGQNMLAVCSQNGAPDLTFLFRSQREYFDLINEERRQVAKSYESSTSWRVTAPLRKLKALLSA